jgi:AraC-like DNA-binding protein
MISERALLDREGVQIADVACRHPRGHGRDIQVADRHAIVFIRRGCFVRRADGVERLLDPVGIDCINPGQEHRYDHPHSGGDDCTSVRLSPDLVASLWGDDPTLPTSLLPSSPKLDLEHRRLLAAARRGHDAHELIERTISLVAATLEHVDPDRVAAGRPATMRGRRVLEDAAREALAADSSRSLTDLAGLLGVSPHHLSRIFHAITGHTISRHRTYLRARLALERLANGEPNLGRLAADIGFADQAHLSRVIHRETGHTPSALRRLLA